ncbi:MAG: hypothetical protein IPH44_24300 [Myxococcales bacterium]|nr:hypothetical protein [Myxococcales bacterium]MBK7191522.1 hypothetical protein [Myxococcales bacterium]MBP6843129.1 hypothetical protein [Kofleriaceae bacterium]
MRARHRLISLLIAVAACGPAAAPAPAIRHAPPPAATPAPLAVAPTPVDALPIIPATPQPAPDGLLVTASVGDPLATLTALVAYADAVKPGIGAMLSPAAAIQLAASQGVDLRGVDLTRPVRAFLLDPRAHAVPVIAVVAVADEAALRAQVAALGFEVVLHGGWAAIGDRAGLRAAAPYALTTAVATAPPALPRVTIAVATVMTHYRAEVQAFFDQMVAMQPPVARAGMAPWLAWYADVFAQLDRVELDLTADRARAGLALRLVPRPDGSIAAFARQQRPGEFKLLERMPAAAVAMGGRLDTSAVFARMLELSRPNLIAMGGTEIADVAMTAFARWPALANGENAVTAVPIPGKLAVAALWDISDGAAAQALWLDYLTALGRGQQGLMQTQVDTNAARYRGVRFARARSTSSSTAMQPGMALYGGQLDVAYAVPGPLFAMAMGGDSLGQLRQLTDVALPRKRPRPTPPALAATLALARAAHDSYVIAVDAPVVRAGFTGGAAPAPSTDELALLALGFDGDAVVLRAALPATQLAPLLP